MEKQFFIFIISSVSIINYVFAEPQVAVSQEILQEKYISYSCKDVDEYIKKITGSFCDGKKDVISTKDYQGAGNYTNKARNSIELTAKMIQLDRQLNEEYSKAITAFNKQIKSYSLFSSNEDNAYSKSLVAYKTIFMNSERSWIIARDRDCSLETGVIPPGVSGSNGFSYFNKIECHVQYINTRIEFLKKINHWLSLTGVSKV